MRHGQSTANVENLIISLPKNGLDAYGLSELGQSQATQSASSCGLPPDTLIVSSDFQRARETALAASSALKGQWIRFDPLLRERTFGELEGATGDRYPEVWAEDEKSSATAPFGAEPTQELVARLARLIVKLESEYREREILLVSHGDPLRFLQLWAVGRPLTEHLQVKLFQPAEIRALTHLPAPDEL